MEDMDIAKFILIELQMMDLAIGLGALGNRYKRGIREKESFTIEYAEGHVIGF